MRQVTSYDKDYKVEVCKSIAAGKTVPEVAKETGISESTLYTWVARYRKNSVKPFVGSGHIKPEDEEFKKLQKENRELREENEILKKAAAYFARNQR